MVARKRTRVMTIVLPAIGRVARCWIVALATVLIAAEVTVHQSTAAVAAPQAGLWRALIRKALQRFARKAGKELGEELLEETVDAGARLARRYGDDVVKAVSEAGPSAVRAIERAEAGYARHVARLLGRYGTRALPVVERPALVKLIARYGDEVAEALVRHGATPAPLVRRYGSTASKALVPVSRRNMRRLMMWFEDGVFDEAGEQASRQFMEIVARRGDEAVDVVWRAYRRGVPALRMIERYGDDAVKLLRNPRAVSLIEKYGDDAAGAIIRHGDTAVDLIETYGDDAVRLLLRLDAREASRLYALLRGPSKLPLDGRGLKLFWECLRRHGKRALDFMWRHRKELAVAGVLAAFLAGPEPYLEGTRDLGEVVPEDAVEPPAETPQEFPSPLVDLPPRSTVEPSARLALDAGQRTQWAAAFALVIAAAIVALLTRFWFIRRARRRTCPTGGGAARPTATAERTNG